MQPGTHGAVCAPGTGVLGRDRVACSAGQMLLSGTAELIEPFQVPRN